MKNDLGLRIIKGKDNFKPVKEIYDIKYIYREVYYIKNHLDAWKSEVISGLNGMKIVIDNHKDLFNNQKKLFLDKIYNDEEYIKISDDNAKSKYVNENYELELKAVYGLLIQQRDSALISILSLMEGNLNRICNEFEICLDLSIKLKDLTGKGSLDNYWIFFKKVLDINVEDLENYFSKIKDYYYLRNRIIHESSIIKDDVKASKFEKEYRELKVYHEIYWHKFYINDDKFLYDLIENLISFFEKLYDELYLRVTKPIQIFLSPNSTLVTLREDE